jgi:hypothetical protein
VSGGTSLEEAQGFEGAQVGVGASKERGHKACERVRGCMLEHLLEEGEGGTSS